ncbi:hypothetical protein, conserved [Leishmania tarentolae]|uniref:Uncharacterized protein n=1 Tax=Leishmania tarentolae TaxID=5689 RepID=A0A640KT03_LEITA|nr:hypothetical protein, conserved [Leishmania tarentolae]
MSKSFPRLSLLTEEEPLLHRTASNGVALLPPSALHGAFVAVVAHGEGSAAPMFGAFDLLRSPAPAGAPVLSLGVYTLGTPPLRTAGAASNQHTQSPDLMLVHTVSINNNGLRCTPWQGTKQRQMGCKGAADLQCSPPAADSAETSDATEAAWIGKNFFSPQPTGTVQSTTPLVEVEKIAWVGLRYLAVKTTQRQVLLVRSGLTENASSSSSEIDDDTPLATLEGLHGNHNDSSAVCASFSRVSDFCTASTTDRRARVGTEGSPVWVMILAGLQSVTGVVCSSEEEMAGNPARKATSPRTSHANPQPQLKEHTWNIGPFNHVAATALDNSQVCICATSLSGSVEVYAWTVETAHGDVVPICLHQVLMAPGHFFYGIAVAASPVSAHETAKKATQDVGFWIMGGESSVAHGGLTALNCNAEGKNSSLTALRGLDGHVIQVNSQPPQGYGKEPDNIAPHETSAVMNAVPRTLNSLWVRQWNSSAEASDGDAQNAAASRVAGPGLSEAALSTLEAVSSLRIEPPCFLPQERRSVVKDDRGYVHSKPNCALATRYALLVCASTKSSSGTEDGTLSMFASSSRSVAADQKVSWSSAVLPLDNAEGAAALDWLAEASSEAGTPPPLSIVSVAPAFLADCEHRASSTTVIQHVHSLFLSTPRRILQLGVSHRHMSTGDNIMQLGFDVKGTYEVKQPQRIVGIAPVFSAESSTPLLCFYGTANSITANGDGSSKDKWLLYGQQQRKSTWAVVADIHASLLHRLTPWRSPATAMAMPQNSNDVQAHLRESELLEKVEAMVRAEGARLQRRLDDRMDRLEAMLQRLLHP